MPLASGIPLALAALFSWFTWRDWKAWRSSPSAPSPAAPQRVYVYCAFFLATDAVLLGSPMLGTYAVLVLLFWLIPRALLAAGKPDLRRHRLALVMVTTAALALDFCAFWLYETTAQARVTDIAVALDRYRSRQGSYPPRLEDLVPVYLPSVPSAKPGFIVMNGIWYVAQSGDAAALMYVSFPPFGRKVYDVRTRAWTDLD